LSVEDLRIATRVQEPYSKKRARDLVDQFLDRIAGAPVQLAD
jgi:hypothetical protein